MRVGIVCRALVLKSYASGMCNAMIGWAEYFKKLGHNVDLITDSTTHLAELNEAFDNIYYPAQPLTYGLHSQLYQFQDGFNIERCLNFRGALVNALTSNIYDVLICNEPESALVAYQMQLYNIMKIVYFIHEAGTWFRKDGQFLYNPAYFDLIELTFQMPILIGFPAQPGLDELKITNGIVLPYPIPDRGMLKPHPAIKQEGVLYNARVEDRKEPKTFVKVMAEVSQAMGGPVLVKFMTKQGHGKKAEELCKKAGLTRYIIEENLTGDEKREFIASSKIGFHPSAQETFGLSAFESLRYHPTVLLNDYSWYLSFMGYTNLRAVPKKSAAEKIYELYNQPHDIDAGLVDFQNYQLQFERAWQYFLKPIKIEQTRHSSNRYIEFLRANKGKAYKLKHLMSHINDKNTVYLFSDIFPFYRFIEEVKVEQTAKGTYIGIPDGTKYVWTEFEDNTEGFVQNSLLGDF